MDVVQARRGVGLAEVELERATEDRDRRDEEEADLDDELAHPNFFVKGLEKVAQKTSGGNVRPRRLLPASLGR